MEVQALLAVSRSPDDPLARPRKVSASIHEPSCAWAQAQALLALRTP